MLTLGERLGLPLFVTPLLVAAGALAAMGKLHLGLLLLVTTVAASRETRCGTSWDAGRAVHCSGLLCRISFQPDSCVRRSQMALAQHTGRSLLWASGFPGWDTSRCRWPGRRDCRGCAFISYNAAGSILWLAVLLASGYVSVRTVDWLGVCDYGAVGGCGGAGGLGGVGGA